MGVSAAELLGELIVALPSAANKARNNTFNSPPKARVVLGVVVVLVDCDGVVLGVLIELGRVGYRRCRRRRCCCFFVKGVLLRNIMLLELCY